MVQAKESVNASGGNAKGSGETVAYSVVQVVYTSITGGISTVAQGVQNPNEIFIIDINFTARNISLTVFPEKIRKI